MVFLLRVVGKQRSPIAYIGIQFQIQLISSVIYVTVMSTIHFKTIPHCQTKSFLIDIFVIEKILQSLYTRTLNKVIGYFVLRSNFSKLLT